MRNSLSIEGKIVINDINIGLTSCFRPW